jgi:hypothetical protein
MSTRIFFWREKLGAEKLTVDELAGWMSILI